MKTAELIIRSKGVDHVCLFDPQDRDLIEQFTWSLTPQGYAVTRSGGKAISMHRLIMGITDPEIHVDHVNHNERDNTRANLRICTRSENQHNRMKQKSSTNSKGVTRYAGKFFVQIRCNNVYEYLGLYRSERTAARVYDQAARRLHGAFACTNNLAPLPEQMTLSI